MTNLSMYIRQVYSVLPLVILAGKMVVFYPHELEDLKDALHTNTIDFVTLILEHMISYLVLLFASYGIIHILLGGQIA